MNHPHRDEWPPYLDGEDAPADAQRLTEHLRHCSTCAAEIAGWQRTIAKLDAWKLPAFPSRRRFAIPFLKWAAAAAIVVAIGFAGGRLSTPAVASLVRAQVNESFKASLTVEMRQQLRQELNADLALMLAATRSQLTNEVHLQLAAGLDQAATAATGASSQETRRLLNDLVQALDQMRNEDQQATQAMYHRLQERQDRDYISLRTDLETVASSADDEIRDATFKLIQLAATTQTDK